VLVNRELLKKRTTIAIYMDLLTMVRDGPLGPTRLARACNLPFDRVDNYVNPLVSKGFVRREFVDGHESFEITAQGLDLLAQMESVLQKLKP
jgi:predicted transcriptional regulator